MTQRTATPDAGDARDARGDRRKPVLTLRANSGWAGLNFREIWACRDLLLGLAGRDLKVRYKQTALGVIWVVLQPLLAAGIFSFVFGVVAKLPSGGVPRFVFSYAGLLGWNLLSQTISRSSTCLVGNAQLISKVFFPRLVLPLATVPAVLVDLSVAAGMMAALLAVYRIVPFWGLILLPVWMGLLLMLALGIGLVASSLMVSYRDIQYILSVLLQVLLYASPVAYSVSDVPEHLRGWYLLNPLAPLLEAFRWSILGSEAGTPAWGSLACAAAVSVTVLGCGVLAFRRMERRFADVI